MIDLVTLWAGAASIGCGSLTYLWLRTRIDRDEARADLTIEQNVAKALEGRVNTLRGDNIALEAANKAAAHNHDQVVADRDSAVRELGRIRAEAIAKKPKRGPNGKFIARPKATITPISGSKCAPKSQAQA